jgi:KamA family protein
MFGTATFLLKKNKLIKCNIMDTDSDNKKNTSQPPGNRSLPYGGLPEVIPPYLRQLVDSTGGPLGPIGLQFVAQPLKEQKYLNSKCFDPLNEGEHEVLPGLIYKYRGRINSSGKVIRFGRVLWTITHFCGAYCRFCTRGREVGYGLNNYSDDEINKVFKFIKQHQEINEVIISGGDPLLTSKEYLNKIIKGLSLLQKNKNIDIIRIGTRLPISNPISIQNWHFDLIKSLKNPYLMVHINHYFELTPEVLNVLNKFRYCGATIMSQTVLLKGVNDSVSTLICLFNTLTKEGIRPYYLYQNDPVPWSQHFNVSINKAIKIWEHVRPSLSGLAATVRFVVDTPNGYGKIPLPEGGAWQVNYHHFFDFKKKKHLL